ncbi:hypothetical protein [Citrobacter koseri]|uniref:hypothetical protein n=1 Tax=Citrobacter koseri TaxID=545 RepID=UPI0023B156EC|nr:hypothetical protein [Citrobacter koseri]
MNILDKVVELIKWVDSTKKLVSLIILVCFGISSFSVWEYRVEIIRVIVGQAESKKINEAELDKESIKLLHDLDAEVISIWSVDPERNKRTLIYRRNVNGREKVKADASDVLFKTDSKLNNTTVKLMTFRAHCDEIVNDSLHKPSSNLVFNCAVPIPPAYKDGFIGLLVVGFTNKPDHEDYLILKMKQASQAIVK